MYDINMWVSRPRFRGEPALRKNCIEINSLCISPSPRRRIRRRVTLVFPSP